MKLKLTWLITLFMAFVMRPALRMIDDSFRDSLEKLIHSRFKQVLLSSLALIFISMAYELHILQYPIERQIWDAKVNLSQYYNVAPESISFTFINIPLLRGFGQFLLGILILLGTYAFSLIEGVDFFN